MTGFGVLLIILGVGSLLLPVFNVQFRLMEFVDPYQPWAGILVAVIGAALVAYGLQRSRAAEVPPASTAAAPTASTAAAPTASATTTPTAGASTTPTTSGATAPPEAPAPVAPAGQAVPPPVDTSVPDAPRPAADKADAAADTNRDQP